MLSRSNSYAGERLRGAKSNSSILTNSSGHRRSAENVDPFVAQRDAEAAALEAYKRANRHEQPEYQAYRPPPPRPQRRKSQINRRSEGSHLEDSRLGARVSAAPKAAINSTRLSRDPKLSVKTKSVARPQEVEEEQIVTRRRSVIQPSLAYATSSSPAQDLLPTSSSYRQVRKLPSVYGAGSPTPRDQPTTKQQDFATNLRTASRSNEDTYGKNLSRLLDFKDSADVTLQLAESQRGSIRETQNAQGILATARDKCLQDFHHKKVRQRKSFIVAPFQKLRSKSSTLHSTEISYDTSLPPFNYADTADPAPRPSAPSPPPPRKLSKNPPTLVVEDAKALKKTRAISGTWMETFRKAFRRSSRASSGMPLQHIESKHLHFTVNSKDVNTQDKAQIEVQPLKYKHEITFVADPVAKTPDVPRVSSIRGTQSVSETGTTKSRVTSWNDSVIAGTLTTRDGSEHLSSMDEQGSLRRSNTASTLKRTGSFFGRPVRGLIRRASRTNMACSSDETERLYSALQQQINRSHEKASEDSATVQAEVHNEPILELASSRDTLPSQRRHANSSVNSSIRWAANTIRSVTPDPMAYRLAMPSPIKEVFSPGEVQDRENMKGRVTPLPRSQDSIREPSSDGTPTAPSQAKIRLQRRTAKRISTPSKAQIARRIELSENRWQAPLQEGSTPLQRSTHVGMMVPDPHMLQPVNGFVQRTQDDKLTNTEANHSTTGNPSQPVRHAPSAAARTLISPSVYSRATNDSPRPDTPWDDGGMSVVITGHEVKRYALAPGKGAGSESYAIKTSHDWRTWMHKELTDFEAASPAPEDLTLTEDIFNHRELRHDTPSAVAAVGPTEILQQAENSGLRHVAKPRKASSASPAIVSKTENNKQSRPQLRSRQSSYMNERYPILESGPKSSDKNIETLRKTSAPTEGRSSNSGHTSGTSSKTVSTQDNATCNAAFHQIGLIDRYHPFSRPRPRALLEPYPRSRSAVDTGSAKERSPDDSNAAAVSKCATEWSDSIAASAGSNMKSTRRPKSAFNLGANYQSMAGATKAVNIRRKPVASALIVDDTIRRISAGPYASQPFQHGTVSPGANKENTPPPPENCIGLPALSSSEWLGSGTSRKIVGRGENRGPSAYQSSSCARASSSANVSLHPSPNVLFGKGSPGQNMASEYLDRRKKEESPAFV